MFKFECETKEIKNVLTAFNNMYKTGYGRLYIKVDSGISLIFYDKEFEFCTKINGNVVESDNNEFVVDFGQFYKIIYGIKSKSAKIKCNLQCKKLKSDFNNEDTVNSFKINSDVFKDMLKRSLYPVKKISNDYFNKIGDFVKFEIAGKSIKMISMDGYRASEQFDELEGYTANDSYCEFVIKPCELEALKKILPKNKTVSVDVKNSYIVFSFDGNIVKLTYSKDYVDYYKMFNRNFKLEVSADRKKLLDYVKQSKKWKEKGHKMFNRIRVNDDVLTLTYRTNEVDVNSVKMDVTQHNKGSIDICFDSKYLQEALSAINTENVIIKFTDRLDITLFIDENWTNHNYVCPVNIKD